MRYPEKLLHFIWRYKLINPQNLKTTAGEELQILDFGQYNTDAGADFEFAKIRLNGSVWAGNVEMHVESQDWNRHNHQHDARYNTTILHVVWEADEGEKVLRQDGTEIPTLAMKDFVDPSLPERYMELMQQQHPIACAYRLPQIASFHVYSWLDRVLIERLETKSLLIEEWLEQTANDWEKVTIISLARSFGMAINQHAFERLMKSIPLNLIYKYAEEEDKLEALLFGCAGLLDMSEMKDSYARKLKEEFQYLKMLHRLQPMEKESWKFMRMRPYNFPTIRLAQLCALLRQRVRWFEYIRENSLETVMQACRKVEVASYWNEHFHFGKVTKVHPATVTESFVTHLVVNTFVPVLFAYGRFLGDERLKDKAVEWLSLLPSEDNNIIRKFRELGVQSRSAGDGQAILQLYKSYCVVKRCLDCALGYYCLR